MKILDFINTNLLFMKLSFSIVKFAFLQQKFAIKLLYVKKKKRNFSESQYFKLKLITFISTDFTSKNNNIQFYKG